MLITRCGGCGSEIVVRAHQEARMTSTTTGTNTCGRCGSTIYYSDPTASVSYRDDPAEPGSPALKRRKCSSCGGSGFNYRTGKVCHKC